MSDSQVAASAAKPKLTPVLANFEASIKLWWKNLLKFIKVYLWGLLYSLIPLAVLAVFLFLASLPALSGNTSFRIVAVIISVASILAAIYFAIRAYLGVFLVMKNGYQGDEKKIFTDTAKYFWPYLGLVVMTAIFVILWSLLLIIPGIIYSVLYSMAVYAFFFEEKRGMEAIRRSVRLVKGYFWPVFGRILFIGLVFWIVSVVISAPLGVMPESSLGYSLWNGLVQVVSFLLGPLSAIYSYSIFQDLAKAKHD